MITRFYNFTISILGRLFFRKGHKKKASVFTEAFELQWILLQCINCNYVICKIFSKSLFYNELRISLVIKFNINTIKQSILLFTALLTQTV